ncbi:MULTISPECIES: hypothetical protein [Hyphomicrobiales]|uniref:hypothetical protein n=1 Tax=Hyphomicrobiales TaxID=356 RepID=UPI0025C2EA25|nr:MULTISPECIES: hypothetical protein [Hyphomicrobiales]MBX3559914.1 hypothetical protein [Chelatococcus sp.]MCO5154787.1 hypothetical protein [Shinella sp.]
MKATKARPRRFRGFAALDRRGNLLWGTLRPTEAEARRLFDGWNPRVDGHGYDEIIVGVELTVRAGEKQTRK